jgi:anthranilate synthase/aminodeoxychorismate synthase-like glutamine amidotransferase
VAAAFLDRPAASQQRALSRLTQEVRSLRGGRSVVVIDNYDSFVYNLVQYLRVLGARTEVYRHDQFTIREVAMSRPLGIIVSPGPCAPSQAGLSCQLIHELGPSIPILGVCLGHQCIGEVYGGRVARAPRPIHGRTSVVHHDGEGVFRTLPNPLVATRYHSRVVDPDRLPASLVATAWTPDGILMGIRHKQYPVEGVQFHPESILTEAGYEILNNFLELCTEWDERQVAATTSSTISKAAP